MVKQPSAHDLRSSPGVCKVILRLNILNDRSAALYFVELFDLTVVLKQLFCFCFVLLLFSKAGWFEIINFIKFKTYIN